MAKTRWDEEFPDDPMMAELHEIREGLWSDLWDLPADEWARAVRERTAAALAENGCGFQRRPDGTSRIVPLADADPPTETTRPEPARSKRTP